MSHRGVEQSWLAVLRAWASVWLCLVAVCHPAFAADAVQPDPNRIQLENSLPGTSGWTLTNPARAHEIEGYASLTSVELGGEIAFHVSTVDPSYRVDIYRMGWYAGLGARQLLSGIQLPGLQQPIPSPDATTGLIECDWTSQYALTIPDEWVSGVYLAKLTGSSGRQSYIIFVVRDDDRVSDFLFTASVNTYQAYNNWGGKSLYSFNSSGGVAAVKVSFNRPYGAGEQLSASSGVGAGEFLTTFAPASETLPVGWEYNAVRWLEQNGYDVTYTTDVAVHEDGTALLRHKGLLIVGHNEYWSWQMRSHVIAARDGGINLAVWSANVLYWQVRFEASAVTGAANRTMVCYKSFADPVQSQLTTVRWRQLGLPEAAVLGVHYILDPVNADIVVTNTAHWVFAGSGLQDGDRLPGLLGYEIDALAGASPPNVVMLGSSSGSHMTIYEAPSGAFVFATGSMQWNWGLDDYHSGAAANSPALRPALLSPAAQQVSRNVLARFLQPPTLSPREALLGPGAAVQFRVLGTGSGNVTWSMDPSVGTLSPTGLYTAPDTIAEPQSVTIAVTNPFDPGLSASAVVTLSPTQPVSMLRLDSGSAATTTDPVGQIWAADSGFTAGSTFSVAAAITSTATPALYQSQRYGRSFSYQLAVPPATYVVNLKFAELYYRSIGQRRFNVAINGPQVLQDFDIVATAGAAFTAVDRGFQVAAPAGQIVIQFQTGAADIPAVNAIEILRIGPSSGGALQVSPAAVTLIAAQSQTFAATAIDLGDPTVTWTASPSGTGVLAPNGASVTYTAPAAISSQQTVTVTATSVADGSIAASATVTLLPTIVSAEGTLLPPATQIVDTSGAVWTLSGATVLRNGAPAAGGSGVRILWTGGSIYVLGSNGGSWWRWTGSGWTNVGPAQPGGTVTPPPPPPGGTPSADGTQLPPATQIVDTSGAVWTLNGAAVLRNGVSAAGGSGVRILWAGGSIYVLGSTGGSWWRWTGSGWTNVGPTQPGGTVTPPPPPPGGTPSADGTLVPPSTQIVDAQGAVWTLSGGAVLRNGVSAAGGSGVSMLWSGGSIYVLSFQGGNWWRWSGTGWTNVGSAQPGGTVTPPPPPPGGGSASPDGTVVPPATQIVDAQGAVWTLGGQIVLRNGLHASGGTAVRILWLRGTVYVLGSDSTRWWRWNGSGWTLFGTTQPS